MHLVDNLISFTDPIFISIGEYSRDILFGDILKIEISAHRLNPNRSLENPRFVIV
jgi:hypothetical protein